MRLWKGMSYLALAGVLAAGMSQAGNAKKGTESPARAGAGEVMEDEPKVAIGAVVPDFTLKDSEGKEINLTKYRGDGIVVVTFLSKKCPVSHALHPVIAAYAKEYEAKGVRFLGIKSNVTEEAPEVAAAIREQGIAFPVLDDPGYKLADALDALGTPHMYIIDKEGRLRYSGAICDYWKDYQKAEKKFFKEALDQVLAGKSVADPRPSAFIGCSFKRRKQVG
jgi:peroxiredoxin